MARPKLKELLHKHQGRDYELEKQKKLQKEAKKRKQKKAEQVVEDADTLDSDQESDQSEEWEDASESIHSEAGGVPLADESDSESELEFQEAPQDLINGNHDANGRAVGVVEDEDDDDDDDDDDEDDEKENDDSDIALSDLSDEGSALEDVVPHQRLTINNTAALNRAIKSIALPVTSLPFSEHMSIISPEPISIPDIDDDLNRELAFYSQALNAAKEGRRLLVAEGVPFTRPNDFFAEMVKTDEHMDKIKSKMVEEASNKKAAADARKQRDLKKFGKQVQQEKLKERAQAKNQMLEKVKLLKRKRQGEGPRATGEEDLFDVALEDAATGQRKDQKFGRQRDSSTKGIKRRKKDEKFGFGGKKRFKKSGDAVSSADMSGYSTRKMKGSSAKGKPKRLGKSRRVART